MNEQFDFETFGEQPYLGELEEEHSRRRGFTSGNRMPGYASAISRARATRQRYPVQTARQFGTGPLTLQPRPRPGKRFPIRFPVGGPLFPLGADVGSDQAPLPNGTSSGQPGACPPCNCPSCTDRPSVNQPATDQSAHQPNGSQAAATHRTGDQPSGDELSEFFYPQNEFGPTFEYESFQGELNQSRAAVGVAQGSGDPRIIDLTARADKSRRLRMRDPKKVYALVLHQMACCFKVRDPLTRFLKMAVHFAILPDGRILQLHPVLALTGASNGFNAGSVAVEFAGNFPDTKGKWWHGPQNGMNQVTPAQIEAGRYLVRYMIRTMGLKVILAHRQSSGTRDNDPGPDIWFHVGQWAIDNLGLQDGGSGFKVGSGNPIPDLWRKWGQTKPQPEFELGNYEYEQSRHRRDPALAAIAERIIARHPRHAAEMEFERGPVPRWSSCFKAADIERVRKAYKDNTSAAADDGGARCSCIVMLNVALGQLLKLSKKEISARDGSSRRVQMGALTTETIEKAMAQLHRANYALGELKIDFYDRRNRTAGTLKPVRLKRSVQRAVLEQATRKGCWYAFGLSIMDGYHSVLLLVDKTGANAKIYWLDQFSADINDDVTTTLDQRITEKTQGWWQAVMDEKKVGYNTTARLWKLRMKN
jgi:N-acetylmuramoyl-L-alanine amidase